MQHVVDASSVDKFVDGLYLQLRVLARGERRRGGAPDTLHTTALVNELYLKLADAERLRFGEPRQFFSCATLASTRPLQVNDRRLNLGIARQTMR